jgi:hypothetical protein
VEQRSRPATQSPAAARWQPGSAEEPSSQDARPMESTALWRYPQSPQSGTPMQPSCYRAVPPPGPARRYTCRPTIFSSSVLGSQRGGFFEVGLQVVRFWQAQGFGLVSSL